MEKMMPKLFCRGILFHFRMVAGEALRNMPDNRKKTASRRLLRHLAMIRDEQVFNRGMFSSSNPGVVQELSFHPHCQDIGGIFMCLWENPSWILLLLEKKENLPILLFVYRGR